MTGSRFGGPIQLIALGFVIFIGVAGGMYVGSAWSLRSRDMTSIGSKNDSFFDVGDIFPNHSLRDQRSKETILVHDLAKRGPILLVFLRHDCGFCRMMVGYWRNKLVSELKREIQIVLVYDEEEFDPDQPDHFELANQIPCRVVTTDRSTQSETDGIVSTPTVVGVDVNARIKFVISGFTRDLTAELINQYL
jgi:hypothetical protein